MNLNMLRAVNAVGPLFRCRTPSLAQQHCGLRQSVEERLGLPEKPKRPSSAFVKFLSKVRPEIAAKNPQAKSKDIFKIGSELWKNSTEATKNSLKDEFKQEYEKYSVLLTKYNESLTLQQKEEIKEAVTDLKEQKEKREIRLASAKRNKELGKPLKPLTSFLLFAQLERPNQGKLTVGQFQTELSKKWAALPEDAKKKFTVEAAKAKEAYEKTLDVWEKKQIKLGNLDVVRQKTLDESFPKKQTGDK